jgi:hypothetical protein
MMPGQKEQAEILRAGLHLGYRSVADAVAWAESIIEADPDPDASWLEVALAGGRSWMEVAELLKGVAGTCDPAAVCQALRTSIETSIESALTVRNSAPELVLVVGSITQFCDPVAVMRYVFAAMLRVVDRDPQLGETIARELYQLYASKIIYDWPFDSDACCLDEEFEYKTHEVALARMRRFLALESQAPGNTG